MKKLPLKVVVVGAGFFGTKRLAACLAMPQEFSVLLVVDPDKKQRNHIENAFHVPTAANLDGLNIKADLAIIAPPNVFHAPASIRAMQKGMHVLCEKPLAPTVHDARQIIVAAKKYGKIVKTGSNHRFFHTIQKAKGLYDQGAIGKLLFFKGSIGTNGERVSRKWFWDKHVSGGGTFIDNGCHVLDIARMFMGDFTSCAASMTTNLWKKARVEDVGTAIYRTKDNRQAVITSSWIQWAGYLHVELWGDRGYIIIDSTTHDTITVGKKEGPCITFDYSNEQKDSYHRELRYLADCIREGKEPDPNAEDGTAIIAMIEAAYRASDAHIWIPIT